jgi:UDP-N-acetylmuramate dehydrogenase
VQAHYDLLPHNTFGLSAHVDWYVAVDSQAALRDALKWARAQGVSPVRILSGGSNVLLTQDQPGLIIHNRIEGIHAVSVTDSVVLVSVAGGHNWHDLVLWAVENDYGGIENMSLIPGSVGAAPVQNIGAYGVELKDVFVALTAIDLDTGMAHTLDALACEFGYRDSIFKREARGRYCIVEVTLRLTAPGHHQINTGYGDIKNTLASMGISEPDTATIQQISAAVIQIRSSKLPDPAKIGNCGSFFKNPEVPRSVLDHIRQTHPQAPAYDLPNGQVKVPAGWLIEQCGWKGKRVGNTGCFEKQALVLVNHGGATGSEVRQLAHDIIKSVHERFGIALEPEVNIW